MTLQPLHVAYWDGTSYLVAQVSLLMFKSAAADQEGGDQSFLFACDPVSLIFPLLVQILTWVTQSSLTRSRLNLDSA
jgi:hypothetical protein